MLEQIMDWIHNYFVTKKYRGQFVISDGMLEDFGGLVTGQYYKIVGSIFNDGVHIAGEPLPVDETFTGEVWAMAVPSALIALADEITAWVQKYGDVMNSPYQSESFGGYSYSKGGSSSGGDKLTSADWRFVFRSRLNHWRKIA